MTSVRSLILALMVGTGLSWIGLVLVPHLQLRRMEPVVLEETGGEYPPPRSGEATIGAELYRSFGCQYCHTRVVRSPTSGRDIARGWGTRRTVARDYVREQPLMLGMVRFGPDLANIGARQTNAASLLDRLRGEGGRPSHSLMPSYRILFEEQTGPRHVGGSPPMLPDMSESRSEARVTPRPEALALVSYLSSLRVEELFLEVYSGRVRSSENRPDNGAGAGSVPATPEHTWSGAGRDLSGGRGTKQNQ
ncbi:MAG: cbb3-type cytochrome c oxidase subunit II [Verrucomicrobiae bacterium]|nr:cbb3-type cytochrome c oxidase subunit II [Verrucomicrobiae bacterium]